jgi:hypothetical protein
MGPTVRVFHCPKCNRVIRTTVEKCKYCSTPIDARQAEAAADLEDRLSSVDFDLSRTGSRGPLFEIVLAPIAFVHTWRELGKMPHDHPEVSALRRKAWTNLWSWILAMAFLTYAIVQRFRHFLR